MFCSFLNILDFELYVSSKAMHVT